ncbi:TRIM2_3 [Mytilus edulis]|uniref:TRIM2_3 n=1 Tax=Mytilus edulis TaxID=6550 RepID=A0A8S3QX28_MYTED|nr:TRIM2_3 [Mytilus edulis]
MSFKDSCLLKSGEVEVDETEITLRKETSVGREAQIVSQPNINNITMKFETKIQIDATIIDYVSDMIILFDGRLVVVESMGIVNILTSDGKPQKQLRPPNAGGAWSVTQIKLDTIAVTYPNLKTIMMLNIENETTTKVIKLDKRCYGLSFSNNAIVVGLGKNEIRIIDLEGNTQKSIEVQSESQLKYLVHWKDRVVYGDLGGKAVNCIDRSGKQIWQYQQDAIGPRGLCTDTYGNIIVADVYSDRLIVISKDGQESKVLISVEGGMPMCICLNESSGFIGTNLLGSICIAKFNISYE